MNKLFKFTKKKNTEQKRIPKLCKCLKGNPIGFELKF